MNARVKFALPGFKVNPSVNQWFDTITGCDADAWLLGSGKSAEVAISCLLTPAIGDRVMCVGSTTEIFITAIVQRPSTKPLTLGKISQPLHFHASELTMTASNYLSLGCGGDCDINAPRGAVSINCRDLITQVAASWIQSATHCIARFGDWTSTVKQLIRTHSQRQLITAEKEIKVDADVIHMG